MLHPRIWRWRVLFVALAAGLIFVQLLPLSAGAGGLPGPDLLVCLALAWVLRRPDHVPALLIAAVFLVQDLLVMRPPGLWAATVLVATEALRGRAHAGRDMPFVVEWGLVGVVLVVMTLAYRLALALALAPQHGLGLTLVQLVMTFLFYPAVAFVMQFVFRIRRAEPGALDMRGRAL